MDAVDAVACDISVKEGNPHIVFIAHAKIPFPVSLKQQMAAISAPEDFAIADVALGKLFARAILKLTNLPAMKNKKVEFISSHGQTIYHNPKKHVTLQLGEPSVISAETKTPVWNDFRSADMANGGQGAPLAPVIHLPLFCDNHKNVSAVNIGGIANITHIPANAKNLAQLLAYDTGPGNMLLDFVAKQMHIGQYDKGGRQAAEGEVNAILLKKFLSHPYFKKRAPKSTGREIFGETFLGRALGKQVSYNKNLLATLTELTARTITDELKKLARAKRKTERLIICGGGANNSYLIRRIAALAGNEVEVVTSNKLGIPVDQVEGALIALLGFYAHNKTALDLTSITGSKNKKVLLGKFTPA